MKGMKNFMKRGLKLFALIIAVCLTLSVLTGCEFWDNIVNQIGGDTEDYTLTKGYTYHDTQDATKVSFIRSGEVDSFKYKLYSNYVEITGYTGSETDIEIPAYIEGTPVTEIGNNAFHLSEITSVRIPDTVVEIQDAAFYEAKRLLEVTFGSSVTVVGKYAFFGCESLDAVYLNDALRVIKEYAFNSCSSLESIVITDGVEEIGEHAFYLCQSMYKAFVPGNVSKFGNDVFGRCNENFKIYAPMSSPAYNYAQSNMLLYVECNSHLEQSYNEDTNDADVSYGDDDHDHGEGEHGEDETTEPA